MLGWRRGKPCTPDLSGGPTEEGRTQPVRQEPWPCIAGGSDLEQVPHPLGICLLSCRVRDYPGVPSGPGAAMTEAPGGAAHSWLVWACRSPIQTRVNIGHPASPGPPCYRDLKEALLIFLQSHCPQSSDPGWPAPNSTSSPTPWLVKTVGLAWAAGEVGGK